MSVSYISVVQCMRLQHHDQPLATSAPCHHCDITCYYFNTSGWGLLMVLDRVWFGGEQGDLMDLGPSTCHIYKLGHVLIQSCSFASTGTYLKLLWFKTR